MKTQLILSIVLTCLLAACGGKKLDTSSAPEEKKSLAFTLPEVPVMLQSVEDRLDFVVRHYWDNFNFRDTAYIHTPDITEQALVNYIDLLQRIPLEKMDTCLTQTMQHTAEEEKMQKYFAQTFRRYLLDPNSPIRNEVLYEPVARFLIASPIADEAMQSRAHHDLKLINMNRVGTVAADFIYTLPSGVQKRMHNLRSPYTILLFYNPDCHGCAETLASMKQSPILGHPTIQKQIKILAFYPDEDLSIWEKHRHEIPVNWINSYDKELKVMTDEVYDLKAIPTLYLLDKDKKVLLKDAAVGEIEEYFENKSF